MMLAEDIYLVGSGFAGFSITNALDCNVYLVDCGSELVMVDCGSGIDTELILARVVADGLDPKRITRILLTHAHADHSGGCKNVVDRMPSIAVCGSAATANLVSSGDEAAISLDTGRRSGYYPSTYGFRYFEIDEVLAGGQTIEIGDKIFTMLDTPGHCADHMCFLMQDSVDEDNATLFSGDCVFCSGRVSLQALYDCNLQDYISTLQRLEKLSIRSLLPGHSVFALENGSKHIQIAADAFHKGGLPMNLV